MKKINLKDYFKKIKELWAIPRYRALIKLCLYGIMFIFIIVLANVYQETNKLDETEQNKSYTEIINGLDLTNCEVVYNINTSTNKFTLEGKIDNNILSGYLEYDTIKKIIVKEGMIYQVINEVETIHQELSNELISQFLIPSNIIELVQNETAYINKGIEETTYTFEINNDSSNYEIIITIKEENLSNIKISNQEVEYNMQFDFDKKV